MPRGLRVYRKQSCHIAQLVGLQAVNEAVLLAEALLKQLLVGAVDVAEPLAQVTIVAATHMAGTFSHFAQYKQCLGSQAVHVADPHAKDSNG